MSAPCYNTGKVRIGCAYQQPAPRVEGDALTIQSSLLDRRTAFAQAFARHPIARMLRDAMAAFWRWC
jgi:hypothetical protein